MKRCRLLQDINMTPVKLHHGGLAAADTQLFVLVRTHLYCHNGTGRCLVPKSHEILQCLISTRLPQPTSAPVYDICRLQTADRRPQTADRRPQTADCRLQTADCMRQEDCKLNETKNIVNIGGVIINIT